DDHDHVQWWVQGAKALGGEVRQAVTEAFGGSVAVFPPAVGDRADDVGRVDDHQGGHDSAFALRRLRVISMFCRFTAARSVTPVTSAGIASTSLIRAYTWSAGAWTVIWPVADGFTLGS